MHIKISIFSKKYKEIEALVDADKAPIKQLFDSANNASRAETEVASKDLAKLAESAQSTVDIIANSENTGQELAKLDKLAVAKINSDKTISEEALKKIAKSVETSVDLEHVAESVLHRAVNDAIKTDQKVDGILRGKDVLEAESKTFKAIIGNKQNEMTTTSSPRANESTTTTSEESEEDSTAAAPQTAVEQRVNELAGQFRLLYKATESYSVANLSAVEMAKVSLFSVGI